jgi:separase
MITLQALQIECLALQQTLRPDEQPKNLWGTFEKYLATYLRRTQSPERKSKSERYLFVRDVVGKMKKLLNCKDEKELLPLEVYKLICLAASDANLTNESIRWTEDWLIALERVDDNANAALAVLCKVRLAVLELKSLRLAWVGGTVLDTKWLESLEAKVSVAVKELENVARGRKQDVKSLLQETGQLRRSCLGLWTSLDHDGSKIADSSAHLDRSVQVTKKKVRFICDQAFKSVVQFCCKYMSMGISEEEHNQLQLILIPAIDTILSTRLSGFDTECPESWENAEPLLCECSAAVKIMDRERPGCIDRFYEKLSNVYYQIYLLYRKSPSSESKAARALRRSISIMDQRPTSELMTASVSRKYQVLGSSYLAARDYRRSEDAFLLSIKTAVATGLLNRLEELATHGESVRQLINSSDKEIAMVGAVLTGLVKIASRKNDGVATELRLDNIGLTVAIRGLLLEWTLSLALDQRDGNGSVVRAIGERLLDIYELEEMPIRRSRVIAKLLELSVDQPTLLDLEAMQGLGEEVLEWANSVSSSDLDADTSLQAFKDDIVARCSIGLGFSAWVQGSSQPELVWNAFRLWNGIIQLSGSWHSILNRIYNAQKVIKRLEMAVAFFDLKGEADLKLAALELLLKFRNLERPVNYNGMSHSLGEPSISLLNAIFSPDHHLHKTRSSILAARLLWQSWNVNRKGPSLAQEVRG